eukprot:COSAG04_NODE_950_length_9211_cov_69.923068_5_plen_80_part_00
MVVPGLRVKASGRCGRGNYAPGNTGTITNQLTRSGGALGPQRTDTSDIKGQAEAMASLICSTQAYPQSLALGSANMDDS